VLGPAGFGRPRVVRTNPGVEPRTKHFDALPVSVPDKPLALSAVMRDNIGSLDPNVCAAFN
jgi:hypothetical protein